MAVILTEDPTSYPASVSVPQDGDARNAASVDGPFQSIVNRIAHIWTKCVNVILHGGTVVLGGDSGSPVMLKGTIGFLNPVSDSGGIDMREGIFSVNTAAGGRINGPMFVSGTSGRINRKMSALGTLTNGSSTNIDPINANYFTATILTSGNAALVIVPSAAPVAGDSFQVHVATSGSATVSVYLPGPSLLVALSSATSSSIRTQEFIFDGSTWTLGPRNLG
jgi:hypothetical protein